LGGQKPSEEKTMSRIVFATAIAFSLAAGSLALAQTMSTAPDNSSTSNTNAAPQPGMAATTSDSGNLGTGASSSKIGTGTTSHGAIGMGSSNSGVMSPSAPGTTGHGATGANADASQTSTP
jgi:hypothetical protein